MRLATVLGLALLAAPALAVPGVNLDRVAGLYSHGFQNALVGGSRYESQNDLEVVRLAPDKAYVGIELEFPNGHMCSLHAVMKTSGDALVHHGQAPDGAACELRLHFTGGKVVFDDKDDQCTRAYCSASGSFGHVSFPAKSRGPIPYMKELLASADYRAALKAAQP